MDYLKNFISTNGKIEQLNKGLVYIRSVLHLNIAGVDTPDKSDNDPDPKRDCMLNLDSFKKLGDIKEKLSSILGETFQDRRLTKVISQGTVFGKRSVFQTDFSCHSYYGMNPQYLNDVGVPNCAAISKRLREIVPSTELKEQRLNNFINSTIVSDFYDNSTTLLVVMLQKLQLLKIMNKMATKKHVYKLNVHSCAQIYNSDVDKVFNNILNFLNTGSFRMGATKNDMHIYTIAERLQRNFRQLPPKEVKLPDGTTIPNDDYESFVFEFEVAYWEMYSYDDGHSKSGLSFGDVVNMVDGRFKVPTEINKSSNYSTTMICPSDGNIPVSDDSIKSYSRAKYFVNCSGLSQEEMTLLGVMFNGNKRSTPFLIDQDIDLGITPQCKVYAIKKGAELLDMPDITYTEDMIKSLITKLVVTHKWYEELKAAYTALKYWVVQPATETVESHWWLGVNRTLSLPYLGLRRAILPMLLEGDGAEISRDALNIAKLVVGKNDDLFFESMIANATWYWGEYLNQYNSTSLKSLFHKYDNDYFDTLRPHERADALSSAVLGVGVPRPVFSEMGTFFTHGLKSHYKDVVKFGTIKIDHMDEYGYTVSNTNIFANTLVCPSCTGLVTGLGGSLLNGTPYHSIFKINPTVKRNLRSKLVQGYNYYDLWAYGVVQRWQGYDVYYKHPKANGKHKVYAANNVSVAMPPVNPLTMDEVLPYEMLQDQEREHGFGSSIEWLRNYKLHFTWQRFRVEALRTPDYNSMPISGDVRSFMSVDRIMVPGITQKSHNCLLYATYDAERSDFHVAYPEIAIPLGVNVGQLKLTEIDTGPTPEEILPGAPEELGT
nr:capsid protein [Helianthus annus leaf-associated totivirus 9]